MEREAGEEKARECACVRVCVCVCVRACVYAHSLVAHGNVIGHVVILQPKEETVRSEKSRLQ